jgi:dipeptidyl aminopeptidase/acylaminoacyl peptidase
MAKSTKIAGIIILMIIVGILLIFLAKPDSKKYDLLGKEITFASSDGALISGFLSKPSGQGPFPAVVLVHGGQAGEQSAKNLGSGKHAETLKNNGYVILSVDYRNSEYGGKEIDDAIAGVNYVRQLDYVDSEKIGIFGSSHGAYISLLVSEKLGDQLKAVVDNFGPADLIDIYNKSVIERTTCDDEQKINRLIQTADKYFGGSPENGNPLWKERSPIFDIKSIKAPVLIIHGKNDCVIPIEQSYRLRDALKLSGKTFRIKIFENGPHGFIYENTEEAREAGLETLNFFDEYLK